MRQLRRTVERGREAYQAVRYPGDLAAEVLGRRRSWRWVLPVGGLAAAAAAVVVILWPQRPVSAPLPPQPVATVVTSAHQTTDGLLAMPGMPELPSGIELMPQYQEMSPQLGVLTVPSYPGFPSRDFESTESTSTTREAVL